MREIELSLRNVKMLLKEKVVQLKDQVSSKSSINHHGCCLNVFKRAKISF